MSTGQEQGDDDALAGEYVLHLLDAAERAAFEIRLANEPGLRDLVRDWDARFSPLARDIAPATPPAAVKARLWDALFPAPAPRRRPVRRWIAGGLVAAGLGMAVVLFLPDPGGPPAPAYTAEVAAGDGSLIIEARFIAETGTLALARRTGAAPPGRVLELWLIAEGAAAPVSLGVLPDAREAHIGLSDALARQLDGALLAISDEPPGGSPTGAPTGAVLATGPVSGA